MRWLFPLCLVFCLLPLASSDDKLPKPTKPKEKTWEALPMVDGKAIPAGIKPEDIQRALPPGAVFLDFLRSISFAPNPQQQQQNYVVFLVAKAKVRHLDLGLAAQIQQACEAWQKAILAGNAVAERQAAEGVSRLVWQPIQKELPPGTKTVYLTPDQGLCFLPWGALPGRQPGSILLEEFTFATVPHGAFLEKGLEKLKEKQSEAAKKTCLVIGGVQYGDLPPAVPPQQGWKPLPLSELERQFVTRQFTQAGCAVVSLTGAQASTEAFRRELSRARFAHVATHGFYADKKFRAAFGIDERLYTTGALPPSAWSGLVFAGANQPDTQERGTLTAQELPSHDLTGMELAVLAGGETALGDVGGGEGVFGLQRAFHVAGCQNVIATLWKADELATLLLMEEFYRNLWEKKLPKREALRQAQLTVYRQPERVEQRRRAILAALHIAGVPKIDVLQRRLEEPVVGPQPYGPPTARRSPPAWWAAFLLSGVGE